MTTHLLLSPNCFNVLKEMSVWVSVRYMGVIWFVFHVLQLLPVRFTQMNVCRISKSTMKQLQNRIENWTFPDLVVVS